MNLNRIEVPRLTLGPVSITGYKLKDLKIVAKGIMNRLIPIIVTVAFLTYPSICVPSYLIQLRNGSQFMIYQYWEEGNQIKFYFYGGVVGIQKDFVRKITESDVAYREEIDSEERIATESKIDRSTIASSKTAKVPSKAEKEKRDEKIDFEYYREKKLALKAELDDALERIRDASRNKDPEAKKKATEDMREIAKQIYDLTDELKEKNKGVLPGDWWEGF